MARGRHRRRPRTAATVHRRDSGCFHRWPQGMQIPHGCSRFFAGLRMAKIEMTVGRSPKRNSAVHWTGIYSSPGTYALLLRSATDLEIRIGRLGNLQIQAGYYVYIGSALGPGGVRARLVHHMRLTESPHWHIDYLRRETALEAVWFRYSRKSLECRWAKRFAAMPSASMPMVGFGSSDCNCESHLLYFKNAPRYSL
jgi:Uri superfamily endonuclease